MRVKSFYVASDDAIDLVIGADGEYGEDRVKGARCL